MESMFEMFQMLFEIRSELIDNIEEYEYYKSCIGTPKAIEIDVKGKTIKLTERIANKKIKQLKFTIISIEETIRYLTSDQRLNCLRCVEN